MHGYGENAMNTKLKEIRLIRGLTQQEVADNLYCSTVSYSRYENGIRSPSLDMLIKMADYFDVTLDYLLDRQQISAQGLTQYETSLVEAARKADDRAREDALQILASHAVKIE